MTLPSDEAFVPHPLPPAIELDAGLIRSLSAADRRLGELAGLCRAMPGFQLFVQPFIRREAVLSGLFPPGRGRGSR
ncbi:MAG: hypothetical protein K6U03_06015 [Firmicutes bacterium]|nr:hypothetical protein [Bacillota bacterium]